MRDDQALHDPERVPVLRRILAILSLVLFLNLFFFHFPGPVSFLLETLGLVVFLIAVFIDKKKLPSQAPTIVVFSLAILALASIPLYRTLGFVIFIAVLSTISSLGLFCYLLSSNIPFFRSLLELITAPIFLGLSYLKSGLVTTVEFISGRLFGASDKSQHLLRFRPLIIGLIIGIPIVALLLGMFSAADPIFASYIRKVIDLSQFKDLPTRLALSAVLLVGFSPFILLKRHKTFTSPLSLLSRYSFVQEISVVMTLVALAIAAFIIIEWPYIFVSVPFETDLSKFGVATYSEYVRKGFMELLQIALFLYSLIWVGLVSLSGKKPTEKSFLPKIQMVTISLFAIFIASIFRRIWLYQSYHGWSLVRIYGGLFLLFIAGITITLFLRHISQKRWVTVEVVFSAAIVLIIGLFNSEAFIATTHPPTVNKRIDYVYLSRMSPDGYVGWKKAAAHAGQILIHDNLDQQPIINRETRRDISYASLISYQLLSNFHELINEVGTDEEVRAYYQTIIADEIRFNTQNQQEFTKIARLYEPHLYIPGRPAEPIPPISLDEFNRLRQEADAREKNLTGLLKRLITNTITPDELRSMFYIIQPAIGGQFDNPPPLYSPRFIHLNTSMDFYPARSSRGSALDRLYIWNWSKKQAYKNMSQELPLSRLLALQDAYLRLYQKISHQPVDERGYDTDISFNTPFLD